MINGLDNKYNKYNKNNDNEDQINSDSNHISVKRCSVCGNSTSSKEKTKWGLYEYWYGSSENPICKKCYVRRNYQEKFIAIGVNCDNCNGIKTTLTKYGIAKWAKNRDREGGYLCWSCYTIQRNTGKVFSQQRKDNIKAGLIRARDSGKIFGRKIHTVNESIFDSITEASAYWIGFLMADGNVHNAKHGSPIIRLALGAKDRDHILKFANFTGSTHKVISNYTICRGKKCLQYTLKFPSRIIAAKLASYGVVPKKSLIAKVIGLESNRHFWRGVVDGDGYLEIRNGQNTDRIVVLGSHDLVIQLKGFIETNIPDAYILIKRDENIHRLIVYSNTARNLARILYDDCSIALQRKLMRAQQMFNA